MKVKNICKVKLKEPKTLLYQNLGKEKRSALLIRFRLIEILK